MASGCPNCATETTAELKPAVDGFSYLRCTGCGLGRIHPLPPALVDTQFYEKPYFVDGGAHGGYTDYAADERWHRHTARARLRRLARARGTATPGALLDIGAAVGFFLDEARLAGWQVTGVEPSQWAADRARARGLTVVDSLADVESRPSAVDEVQTNGFDAVTILQVLEHLPDPVAVLRRAGELLAPGGSLLCETWDLDSRTAKFAGRRWQQFSAPSVLWAFSANSMRQMLAAAGLEPTSWRQSPKIVGARTVLGQLPAKLPLGPLAGFPVPYVFDDLVTFSARKPARKV